MPLSRAECWILRWFRNKPRNTSCPITQDKLENPIFRYITETGHVVGYCLGSLIQWIKTEGKPIDPMTKDEYNPIVLKRLDREAKRAGLMVDGSPTMYDLCTDEKYQREFEAKRELEQFQSLSDEEKTEIVAENVENTLERLQGLYEVNDARLFPHVTDYCQTASYDILALAATDAKRCEAVINEFQTWLLTTRCKAPSALRCCVQGFMSTMEQAVFAASREEKGDSNQMDTDDLVDVVMASVDHEPAVRRSGRRRVRDESEQAESEQPSRRRRR
jgi:hypothetical protein